MNTFMDIANWAQENGLGDYHYVIRLMNESHMVPAADVTFFLYPGVGLHFGYSPELNVILDAYAQKHGACMIEILPH